MLHGYSKGGRRAPGGRIAPPPPEGILPAGYTGGVLMDTADSLRPERMGDVTPDDPSEAYGAGDDLRTAPVSMGTPGPPPPAGDASYTIGDESTM